VYLLCLWVQRARRIRVGGLGRFAFPAGIYLYAGSARRALRARLGRHGRRRKPLRWHIDYLRRHARPVAAAVAPWARGRECAVARAALALPGARAVVPGFGSSDCRCRAHLIHIGDGADAPRGSEGGKAMKASANQAGKAAGNDLHTLAALARELKASPAALRKAVQSAGIKPDAVRCGCAYYGPSARAAIKKLVTS
jgi:Uri superfamily endonuclease